MYKNRELVSGLLIIVAGLFFSVYSAIRYDLGTLSRMGPGLFPVMMGVVLVVLGMGILIKIGVSPSIDITRKDIIATAYLIASVAFFALTVDHIGILPSSFAIVMLICARDKNIRLFESLFLTIFLVATIYIVFDFLLDINMRLYKWPF